MKIVKRNYTFARYQFTCNTCKSIIEITEKEYTKAATRWTTPCVKCPACDNTHYFKDGDLIKIN